MGHKGWEHSAGGDGGRGKPHPRLSWRLLTKGSAGLNITFGTGYELLGERQQLQSHNRLDHY